MDFTVNRTAKILEKALDGLSARHNAITSNIANAQTSDYTRSDVVFEDQLQNIVNLELLLFSYLPGFHIYKNFLFVNSKSTCK